MKVSNILPAVMVSALAFAGLASPVRAATYFQGFEIDTAGWEDSSTTWFGQVTRVASGTDGITSSEGDWHAIMQETENTGPFSRFDGYRSEWPGTWIAELDIYLDPAWETGAGFDYSVASNGTDGLHQRDFIFHVVKDVSTGTLLVGGSNNSGWQTDSLPGNLESGNHYVVAEGGWYTFQHKFYEDTGALAVDLNLLDSEGAVLFTETRTTALDTIPGEVGGNRYAWFTMINVPGGVAVDAHELTILALEPEDPVVPLTKDECKKDLWMNFGEMFKNQGQCVSYVATQQAVE